MKISNVASIVNTKIDASILTTHTYISTECMLPNCGGIENCSSIPNGKVTSFDKNDILLSNIRPYFKKLWFSTRSGGCSKDVICLRVANRECLPKYLYYALCTDKFIDSFSASSKGTKMPRGDKNALLTYEIPDRNIEDQLHIVDILGTLDEKIENNEKIISNVLKLYRVKFRNLAMKYEQKTVLSYIASVESGKRPLHKSAALDGSFNIPIIGASSIMGYTNDYLFNEPILVIGRVGTLGVVQSIFGKSYPSDNALIIRSKYCTFCYCALNELDYNSLNKGSTQPLITQTDIKNIQIPLIPQSEMQQFEMHNKIDIIVALKEENNMLRELKALYLKKFFE